MKTSLTESERREYPVDLLNGHIGILKSTFIVDQSITLSRQARQFFCYLFLNVHLITPTRLLHYRLKTKINAISGRQTNLICIFFEFSHG